MIFLQTGCGKYDEGPWISFISADHRISGNYTIDKFIMNGIDTTNYYKSLSCYRDITFIINENGNYIGSIGSFSCQTLYSGLWESRRNGRILSITRVLGMPILGPWGSFENFEWTIIKLTDKHGFTIGGKSFNDDYRIEFKRL